MSTGSISGGKGYQGNLVYTPGGHPCHQVHLVLPVERTSSLWTLKTVHTSSYWSDIVHSKVGVCKVVAGWFGSSNLRVAVRVTRGSAAVPAGSFWLGHDCKGTIHSGGHQCRSSCGLWDVMGCDTEVSKVPTCLRAFNV